MATPKKYGDIAVNDGGGLMDTDGYIDSMIVDLNDVLHLAISGQLINAAAKHAGIANKLVNLKEGLQKDRKAQQDIIADLRRANDELCRELSAAITPKEA